jgi:hypothetical protein
VRILSITDDKEFAMLLHKVMDELVKERFATIRERFQIKIGAGNDGRNEVYSE